MGCRGVDDNPGSFYRYFNKGDECAVRSIFRRLIGEAKPAAIDFRRYRIYNNFAADLSDTPGHCNDLAV
jgi:hypothetical protein